MRRIRVKAEHFEGHLAVVSVHDGVEAACASHEGIVEPAGRWCTEKATDGGGGGDASTTAGTDSTVIPRAVEAVAAVARLVDSEACTAATVVEAGTAIVAVMITEAAVTLTETNDASTPAAAAMLCCRPEVSA